MTQWIRFDYQKKTEIGTLTGDTVSEYKGGLFDSPQPTGRSMPLSDVQLKAPLVPHSILHCGITFTNVPKRKPDASRCTTLLHEADKERDWSCTEYLLTPRTSWTGYLLGCIRYCYQLDLPRDQQRGRHPIYFWLYLCQ